MTRLCNAKGLTRVEVVIVILVGVFVLSLLPVACRRTRSDAARAVCAANLATLGKAMLVYANDHQGEFPRAGGPNTCWGELPHWDAPDRYRAFWLNADGSGGKATISSCFYLLVKYMGVPPKHFICPGDKGTVEFTLAEQPVRTNFTLADAWDFGWDADRHCSYAYQVPFGLYALKTTDDPGMPVAADRNPWLKSPDREAKSLANFRPDLPPFKGTPEQARAGNSVSHGEDGQNVLFLDGHVMFEERSCCGLDTDNIYLISIDMSRGSPIGTTPVSSFAVPANRRDSVLVHDSPAYRATMTLQPKDVDSKSLKQTTVVATLDCPLPEHNNVIWCSTFQMAWDKFKKDIIGEPIQLVEAEKLAGRLNQAEYPTGDIEAKSYYATAGFVKNGIIEQIQKGMAKRFPSEPVPAFDGKYRTLPDAVVAYAYLNVDVGFQYPYYTYLSGSAESF
jgi:prepilin-type processing-associated H-X9-DG protein